MFNKYIRPEIRKFLLKLLKLTEKTPAQKQPVRRGEQKFWQKEITLPTPLVVGLNFVAFFAVLFFEIGMLWQKILGLLILLIFIFIMVEVYLRYEESELMSDSEVVMLLGLIFISGVLMMQVFKQWVSPLATPIAACTILAGLLISRRAALVVALTLSFILAILNGFSLEYFFVHIFGSLAAIAALPKVRNRDDLARLGLLVTVSNAIAIFVFHLFHTWSLNMLGVDLGWGAISGFSSGLIVLGVLPYLETFFSRTTNIRLLELADFNKPLLKKLMLEAPGTYHHSLIMASMAEQAAEAIGANSLLARVGAYYHDLGKLVKPEYYIENQQTIGNPHDPLSPAMSSLVVISHVKEGVALAKQYNLDRVIIDFIEQHHGTSLIHYFYHRALEQNPQAKADDFRYPGPKPQLKETAILMLADAVEAASRTIEDPSPSRIKDMVEKVINNKFTDGQFTECPITLHDLSMIAESLVVSLSGVYHARIEYQKTLNEEKKEQKQQQS